MEQEQMGNAMLPPQWNALDGMPPKKQGVGRVASFFLSLLPVLAFFGVQVAATIMVMIPMTMVGMMQMQPDLSSSTEYARFCAELIQRCTPPATALAHILAVVLFAFWYRLSLTKPRPKAREIMKKMSWKAALLAVGMGILMCLFSNGIANAETLLFPEMVEAFYQKMELAGIGIHPAVIFVTMFVGPVGEELIFRGLTLKYARRAFQNFWLANLMQAFLFGLVHMNWVQGVYAFFGGLVMGWLVKRYGSIVPAILMHMTVNIVSTVGLDYLLQKLPLNWGSTLPLILLPGAVAAGLMIWQECELRKKGEK